MSRPAVEDHLGLVNHIAKKMYARTYVSMDFDEMVSAGVVGLIQAVDTFDPERGFLFSTFAAPRIRGAILDEMRRMDPLPRSARRKSRRLHAATEALTQRLLREPTEREIADELGLTMRALEAWRRALDAAEPEPLDRVGVDAVDRYDYVDAGMTGGEIEHGLEVEQQMDRVRSVLPALKSQERTVLNLYYQEGLRLHEIGDRLHLTEARISQIRKNGLRKLRNRLCAR